MKVAFWSPSPRYNAVTSNLACISVMISMMFNYKSIIFENHLQKNKINHFIQPRINHNIIYEGNQYHNRYTGMDSILYKLSNNNNNGNEAIDEEIINMIRNVSKDIFANCIFHIANDNGIEEKLFEITINNHILTILNASDKIADLTFIDTQSNNNLSTKIILEEADLIVVNLSQNPDLLYSFFRSYKSIISRCLFLLSNYDNNSYFNLEKISQMFSIDKSNIATVPYSREYKEALKHGQVVSFIISNYKCDLENRNFYFMNEIMDAAKMIHNRVGINIF